MKAADDMKFNRSHSRTFFGALEHFLEGVGECQWLACFLGKSAKFAMILTDIAVIDMTVHDVIGVVAVPALANDLRQASQGMNVGCFKENQRILIGDAVSIPDFRFDIVQSHIRSLSGTVFDDWSGSRNTNINGILIAIPTHYSSGLPIEKGKKARLELLLKRDFLYGFNEERRYLNPESNRTHSF